MLESLFLLLAFQLLGHAAVQLTGLPVPGPVIGLAMLFVALTARPRLATTLAPAADGLLKHLGLLFVPAGVGVSLYLGLLREEWLPIAVALVVSTLFGMAAAALTLDRLLKRIEQPTPPAQDGAHD